MEKGKKSDWMRSQEKEKKGRVNAPVAGPAPRVQGLGRSLPLPPLNFTPIPPALGLLRPCQTTAWPEKRLQQRVFNQVSKAPLCKVCHCKASLATLLRCLRKTPFLPSFES